VATSIRAVVSLYRGGTPLAREIVVHLSDGTRLNVSKEHEAELQDALNKTSKMITLRDSTGARNFVNAKHIVRAEIRS
jgi:hypothetical protein